ncbi:hypothetical protein [Erysipelothrix piscisicarius]|uniref:hypothetical protein n=1 Tax=Erysipelothrix piscisicarius TaxID=2485784 RepID=UPI002F94D39A
MEITLTIRKFREINIGVVLLLLQHDEYYIRNRFRTINTVPATMSPKLIPRNGNADTPVLGSNGLCGLPPVFLADLSV